jgi:DNA sulfur modification protein DndC
MNPVLEASAHIEKTLRSNLARPWTIAFSGGKDSSALVCMIYSSFLKLKHLGIPKLEILYCDTKTENPVVDAFAKRFLQAFTKEAASNNVAVRTSIVSPTSDRTFLSRVVGRGYPPPTNSFRWCTTELRIRPVENHLAGLSDSIVVLGVRETESKQRDRALSLHTDPFWMVAQKAKSNRIYYTPIRALRTEDVWDVIFFSRLPDSMQRKALWELYADAGGDCPIIRSPDSSPCASGRFGCWTCTVVRRDRSGENLQRKGYPMMVSLLNFRQMLLDIRNDPSMRWPRRRNGSEGFGPLTIAARKMLLSEIQRIEAIEGLDLLSIDEQKYILSQWDKDEQNERQLTRLKPSVG